MSCSLHHSKVKRLKHVISVFSLLFKLLHELLWNLIETIGTRNPCIKKVRFPLVYSFS